MIELISIGLGLFGGIAGIMLYNAVTYKASRRQLKTTLAYEIACQALLDQATGFEQVDRALIVKIHNGGKMSQMYSMRFVTVLYEGRTSTTGEAKSNYQSYPMDDAYKRFMQKLLDDKVYLFQTMSEEYGMLRNAYDRERIKTSRIFKLARTKHAIYIASFSSKSPPGEYTAHHNYHDVGLIAEKLKQLHRTAIKAKVLE